MHLLLGVHQFFPKYKTGTEVLTFELGRGLQGKGHRVDIIAGSPENVSFGKNECCLIEDEYGGLPVHRLHYRTNHLKDTMANHLVCPERIALIEELIKRLQPDLVHFNHLMGFSAGAIPKIRNLGVPVTFTPTDFWTLCPLVTLFRPHDKSVCENYGDSNGCLSCLRRIPKWAAKPVLRVSQAMRGIPLHGIRSLNALAVRLKGMLASLNDSDGIFPATEFLARRMALSGVDVSKMKVIPYGVDIGNLPEPVPIPKEFTKATPLRIGYIGTISEIKGPHVLVTALSRLGDKAGNVSLELYGQVNDTTAYQRSLRKQIEFAHGQGALKGTFPPHRMGEILRGLHVLVVPSLWYETAPLVLCSALQASTFVLISRLGGMTGLVQEGRTGFSFAAGSSEELWNRIESILGDPDLLTSRQRLRERDSRSTSAYAEDLEREFLRIRDQKS
jgi:glycosyltransferase involved in cell wall biosynthesis